MTEKPMSVVLKRVFILLALGTLMSCSTISHHEDSEVVTAPPATEEVPATETPSKTPAVIKKTIVDDDQRKRNDYKELKKRVVVLPFIDKNSKISADVLEKARNAFVDSLNTTDSLIALDPSVLKLDLNKYIKYNMYDLRAIAKDVQSVGVSSVLEGRIIDIRFKSEDLSHVDNASSLKTRPVIFEVVVQARMLNLRSEQELFNTVKTVTIEDSSAKVPENITSETFFARNPELTQILIRDAFLDFNQKLIESLKLITWEGRIAALQGDRIYLNVGKISGVQIGDILRVVEDSNEIYDTELGYHIGQVPGKVKGTLEIVGFFGQDGSISVIHSGAGFKENDRVEVYQ